MKARHFTTLALLFLIIPIPAQNVIRETLISPETNDNYIIEYKYDEEGRRTEQVSKYWQEEIKGFWPEFKRIYSYEKGQLKSELEYRQSLEDPWENTYRRFLEFDENGCLLKMEIERHLPHLKEGHYESSRLNYENDFDCRIPWKEELARSFLPGTFTVNRRISNNVERERVDLGGNNTLYKESKYNEEGLLVYQYKRWIDNELKGTLRKLEYDENKQLIEERFYFESELGDFIFYSKFQMEYLYENDLLVEEKRISFLLGEEPFAVNKTQYEYYCDGLLKSKIGTYRNVQNVKTIYEYDRGTACETKEEMDVQIYPNPHSDYFIIESNGLVFENTIVHIYSLDGRLVYRQEIPERVLQLRIDMPLVVGGGLAPVAGEFFMVNLIANDKSFSKKILRVK